MKKSVILFFLLSIVFSYAENTALDIAKKHFSLPDPSDIIADTNMTIIQKNGTKQTLTLKMSQKRGNYGTNSFSEFIEPADVKGTKFLTLIEQNGDNVQRLYLPALKKVKRIASSAKDGSFMGSDLNYFDMEDHGIEDFRYELTGQDEVLEHKIYNGMKFYTLKFIPTDPESPYSYMKVWVNMDNFFIYQSVPFNKKGEQEKTIMIAEVMPFNTLLIGTKTLVISTSGSKTIVTKTNVRINTGLADTVFEIQNLK